MDTLFMRMDQIEENVVSLRRSSRARRCPQRLLDFVGIYYPFTSLRDNSNGGDEFSNRSVGEERDGTRASSKKRNKNKRFSRARGSTPNPQTGARMSPEVDHYVLKMAAEGQRLRDSLTSLLNDAQALISTKTMTIYDHYQMRANILSHVFSGSHAQDIERIKKKSWCIVCLNEAQLYCCWNSTYCTQKCQTIDWNRGHKRTCRR